MSQNNSNAKTAMLAKLDSIHKVEGFDPSPFAVDYTDLNTQETRKRLDVYKRQEEKTGKTFRRVK